MGRFDCSRSGRAAAALSRRCAVALLVCAPLLLAAPAQAQSCPSTCGNAEPRAGLIFSAQAQLTSQTPQCAGQCISLCRSRGFKYYDFSRSIGCECYARCDGSLQTEPSGFYGRVAACPSTPACLPLTFFPISCASNNSTVTIRGVRGRQYSCSFRNPSSTLPIVNYQLQCENYDPLTVGDVTSACTVAKYIAPGASFNFSFVNNQAAGTPRFKALDYPHPAVTMSSSSLQNGVKLKCSSSAEIFRFGDDVLGRFRCNVTNQATRAIRNIMFGSSPTPAPVQATNFNTDGTLSVVLGRGSSAIFSLSLLRGDYSLTLTDFDMF